MICKLNYMLVLLVFFSLSKMRAQSLFEVPLQTQINKASLVVEGEVKVVTSFWNTEKTMIYTVNTIEVHKVFKGKSADFIEIVTDGGLVDNVAIEVSHALELKEGDVGFFTLEESAVALKRGIKRTVKPYRVYSGIQGFYAYDFLDDSVSNIFSSFGDGMSPFYEKISAVTQDDYTVLKAQKALKQSNSAKRSVRVPTGISFTPTTITAGTQSVLTIRGSGFGANKGAVGFRNADDGGASFENALSSEILSWTDTEIRVHVTANAGTGTVRVITTAGARAESSAILNVSYSQLNVSTDGEAFVLQHVDDNGLGGYTFELTPGLFNDTDVPGARQAFSRALNRWTCETLVNWGISNQPSQDVTRQGAGNVVAFDGGGFENLPEGSLGRTITSRVGRTCPSRGEQWYVDGIDIIFNKDADWYFGNGPIQNNQFDFESVALHELGHAHLLDHVIEPGNLMHFRRNGGDSSFTSIERRIAEGGNDVHQRSITNQICNTNVMTSIEGENCTLDIATQTIPGVTIFPNPARDNVFIKHAGAASRLDVRLYDVSGRLIMHKDLQGDDTTKLLDVTLFKSGVYMLTVVSNGKKTTQKLILN